MNTFLQFPAYPTGRPCWIDPFKVDAILDAVEARQPKIVGGPPELAVVGTSVVLGGATVTLAGPAGEVRKAVEHARKAGVVTLAGIAN